MLMRPLKSREAMFAICEKGGHCHRNFTQSDALTYM